MQPFKKRILFLNFSLILTAVIIAVYALFAEHFSHRQDYVAMIERLNRQISREKFNATLVEYQYKDYQQSVALLISKQGHLVAKDDQLRSLASVGPLDTENNSIDLSGVYFQRGRREFEKNEFDKAIAEFQELIERYPLSRHIIDCHFLIAESFFKLKDYKKSLAAIDTMVTHFPESSMTGYILLRMGQISEMNHQMEEASEIYRSVQKNFSEPALRDQAKKMAENVEHQ